MKGEGGLFHGLQVRRIGFNSEPGDREFIPLPQENIVNSTTRGEGGKFIPLPQENIVNSMAR